MPQRGQINNGKTAVGEPNPVLFDLFNALVIRPPVMQGSGHALQQRWLEVTLKPRDAAHSVFLVS